MKQSSIGFLTLLEHHQLCEVGSFFKNPEHPIWVLASDTHLSGKLRIKLAVKFKYLLQYCFHLKKASLAKNRNGMKPGGSLKITIRKGIIS